MVEVGEGRKTYLSREVEVLPVGRDRGALWF